MSSWHITSYYVLGAAGAGKSTAISKVEEMISGLITQRGEIRVLEADQVLSSAFGIALEAQKDHHESSKWIDARLERARSERVAVMSGRINTALVEERARLRSVAVRSIGLKVNRETLELGANLYPSSNDQKKIQLCHHTSC